MNKFLPITDFIKNNIGTYVGILSTSQQVKYGKTKAGKPIYQIHPLKKILPPFWITYGGNLTGRLVIEFKFKEWPNDSKLPFAETVSIIGILDDSILIKTLLKHYQVDRKDFLNKLEINDFEKSIKRKDLKDLTIFSIDPKGCIDIDDALSIENLNDTIKIGVHIAQPICWLTKEEIITRSEKGFSTLYMNKNKNLWSEELTEKASLFAGKEKPAYSIIFTISDNKIINIESFPSTIINKLNTSYEEIDFPFIKTCQGITEKLIGKEIDSHELVSFWMVKANQFVGNNFKNIPFRTQNVSSDIIINNTLEPKISQVFTNMQMEGAFYSYEKDFHHSLNLSKYTHFTSPIRRIIDTIIHWNITYNDNIVFDIDKINILDKKTKKLHQQINLKNIIDKLPETSEMIGWVYTQDKNKCLVYFEELGFMKVLLWEQKFDYLMTDDYEKLIIGNPYTFVISKKVGFLPLQKIVIKKN